MNSFEAEQPAAGRAPRRVKLTICTGTACYVLGGSELLLVEELLAPELRPKVEIAGAPCLGHCRGAEGRRHMPCVLIDGRLCADLSVGELAKLVQEAARALEQ